jgi:large subunit ribosomal protein L24
LKKKLFFKSKIKKDDIVIVLSGKDKGKQGIVLKIVKREANYKLLVEGINIKKKTR